MEGGQCFGKGRACAAGTTEHRQEVATLEEVKSAAQAAQQIAQEKMTKQLPTCVREVVTGRQPGGAGAGGIGAAVDARRDGGSQVSSGVDDAAGDDGGGCVVSSHSSTRPRLAHSLHTR